MRFSIGRVEFLPNYPVKGWVMLDLNEPINVWVYFKGGQFQPYVFFWGSRRIQIETINLVHTTRHGNASAFHFSVSAKGNFYRLAFDTEKLKWFLEAVEEDEIQ